MRDGLPTVERLGDSALLIRWPGGIAPRTNARVHRFTQMLDAERPSWVLDRIPAYSSLAVIVDCQRSERSLDDAKRWLAQRVCEERADRNEPLDRTTARVPIEIPVCYDADFGPDLSLIAHASRLSIDEVITRHCAPIYQVAMLGFSPGFPYMLGLDTELATPRMSTPRVNVPAGSVAIGGSQTGIYPRTSPGGWHIVGRCPLTLFDPIRDSPSLLHAGDQVRFVAISRQQFEAFAS